MFKLDLEKAEEPETKLPTSTGSSKKQEISRKTPTSALLTMPKPLTVWITINCGKFLELGIPDFLTYLLRNLYEDQEATVRTGHGTTDWFQRGKGLSQGCILSLCLFNLYAEYIMRNAGLEEAQAGIKIARRNINNLRYTDNTTLMAGSKEELKNLLMQVKWYLSSIFRKPRSWHPFPSLHDKWGNNANSVRLYFFGLHNHCRWWLQLWN